MKEPLTIEEAIKALELAETALRTSTPTHSHYAETMERHSKALIAVSNALLKDSDYKFEKHIEN